MVSSLPHGPRFSRRSRFGASLALLTGLGASLLLAPHCRAQDPTISTGVGIGNTTGQPTFAGDGAAATAATISGPSGIAYDDQGNLLIVDSYNQRIRKVDTQGVITTVAGNGVSTPSDNGKPPIGAFSGDGGPALQASLNLPSGIAVAHDGTIYFSDSNNNRLRKLAPQGDGSFTITTIAGNGEAGDAGDGGPASASILNAPGGMALDPPQANLFFADAKNHRIRCIDLNTNIIINYAGSTKGSGGDGGPATAAQLNTPAAVAFDKTGALLISDSGNRKVRQVDAAGNISTVAGTSALKFSIGDGGAATDGLFIAPSGIAVDQAGKVYVSDSTDIGFGFGHRVRVFTIGGTITTYAGNGSPTFAGDGGPAAQASLNQPIGLAFDSAGALSIADNGNNRVRKVSLVATQYGAGPKSGDANGDNKTNVTDAVLCLRFTVGATTFTVDMTANADMNGDGKVNIQDVILILKKAAGLP